MKKLSLLTALLAGSLLAGATLASAQDTKGTNQTRRAGERRAMGVEQRVDRMAKELNLTDDQKTKLTTLFEANNQKRMELRKDTSLSREQRQEKLRAMLQDTEKQMKQILTPEQLAKWEKVRDFRGRRPGAPGGARNPDAKKNDAKKTE